MTLDEAIKFEEHTSENYYSLANTYHTDEGVYLTMETKAKNQAEYHEQLVEYLKELKQLREQSKWIPVVAPQTKTERTDGDLISRKAVLEKWNKMSVRGRTEFDQEIMMLPSVTSQTKTGHWGGRCSLCVTYR